MEINKSAKDEIKISSNSSEVEKEIESLEKSSSIDENIEVVREIAKKNYSSLIELIKKNPENLKSLSEFFFEKAITSIPISKDETIEIDLDTKESIIRTLIEDVFLKEKLYEQMIGNSELDAWKEFIQDAANYNSTSVREFKKITDEGIKLILDHLKENERYKEVEIKHCDNFDYFFNKLSEINLKKSCQYEFLIGSADHFLATHVLIENGKATVIFTNSLGITGDYFDEMIKSLNKYNRNKKNFSEKSIYTFLFINEKRQHDHLSCSAFAITDIKKFIKNPSLFDHFTQKQEIKNLKCDSAVYSANAPMDLIISTQSIQTIRNLFNKAREQIDNHNHLKILESKVNIYTKIIKKFETNIYAESRLLKLIAQIALYHLMKRKI